MKTCLSILLVLLFLGSEAQVNQPLGQSPAMGWNSWNFFGKKEINESIVLEVIDAMVREGLQKAGYEYVVVDGGWRDTVLGPNGELLVNKEKFPRGMKYLADYAHSKGLKFGLHTTPGSHDCGMDKVGGWGLEAVHIRQLVDWGIDFIKLDRCRFSLDENPRYSRKDPRWMGGWDKEGKNIQKAYATWSRLIKESGRPILFSASAYRFFDWYPTLSNMGRTTGDIKSIQTGGAVFDKENVNSVMTLALKNNQYYKEAKPGYWNDPDMLVTGKQGLAVEEQKAHFALWCIMTAPLFLGNDPRHMSKEEKAIITTGEAIAVNQDQTEQGRLIKADGKTEVWAKKLRNGNYAVLLLNRDTVAKKEVVLKWSDLELVGKKKLRDIYGQRDLGTYSGSFSKIVAPHASLFLIVKNM